MFRREGIVGVKKVSDVDKLIWKIREIIAALSLF